MTSNKSVESARLTGGSDACFAGAAHFNRYVFRNGGHE